MSKAEVDETMCETGWHRQYYDNLAFYYWEPQHLGRTRNNSAKIVSEPQMLERLRTLEVGLNHQMELFFRLSPRSFLNRFVAAAFGQGHDDDYKLIGREFRDLYGPKGMIQPDIVLRGRAHLLAIELKLESKCSLAQLLKYVMLLDAYRNLNSSSPLLLFMGKTDFAGLWKERFATVSEVRAAAIDFTDAKLAAAWRAHYGNNRKALDAAIRTLPMTFMTYQRFHDLVRDELADASQAHETYRLLLEGMCHELVFRDVATSAPG